MNIWVFGDTETHVTSKNVPERSIGAFAGYSRLNDLIPDHEIAPGDTVDGKTFMHCCLGNGSRAVFYIWRRMIDYNEGQLRINLLLNRASPWAEIHSYIPYEGRVDITIKKNLDLKVRIPEWTQPGDVSCRVRRERFVTDAPFDW